MFRLPLPVVADLLHADAGFEEENDGTLTRLEASGIVFDAPCWITWDVDKRRQRLLKLRRLDAVLDFAVLQAFAFFDLTLEC
jgi:hypothetical protein